MSADGRHQSGVARVALERAFGAGHHGSTGFRCERLASRGVLPEPKARPVGGRYNSLLIVPSVGDLRTVGVAGHDESPSAGSRHDSCPAV